MADKTVKIDIRVKADDAARNIEKVTKSVDSMDKSLKKTASTMDYFKNLTSNLAGFSILGIGVSQLVDMSDQMTLLTSRISIFVGEGKKTTDVMERLAFMADFTKSAITDVAEVFSRVITATQRLNISTQSQLALTQVLQQSFRLSGSTAAESTASTIQFAQALSFGQLRGQELRSVLSQNSVLATVFGRAIEGSGKDIYKFAEAGGFTTKFVLNALAKNFDDIDSKANKMAQTFAQTLTLAMNKVRIAADEINKEFNLNGKFATFMQWLIDNNSLIIAVLVGLAGTYIPALTASVVALDVAMLANPVGIFAVALGGLVAILLHVTNGVSGLVRELKILPKAMDLALMNMYQLLDDGKAVKEGDWITEKLRAGVKRLNSEIDTLRGKNIYNILEPFTKMNSTNMWMIGVLDKPQKSSVQSYADALAEAAKQIKDKGKTIQEQIGILNTQFNKGGMSAEKFNSELYRLTKIELAEKVLAGVVPLSKMGEELRNLELEGFSRLMDEGTISIAEFDKKVQTFQIDGLTEKFKKGKMRAAEFYNQMLKFSDPTLLNIFTGNDNTGLLGGLTNYIESLGTTSEQMASIVTSSFKNMEDAIFESLQSGKRDFSAFTGAVIADLTRMMIRMAILKPLSQGILDFFPTGSGGGGGGVVGGNGPGQYATSQASGGAWNNGTQFFANGGVVGSATPFGMSGGRMGVMGEAGPEAILPLSRGSDGKLGVQGGAPVTINVINQNGSSVETSSSNNGPGGSKVIEILIKNTVKDGIGNGEFDKVMKTNFGTSRKGQ